MVCLRLRYKYAAHSRGQSPRPCVRAHVRVFYSVLSHHLLTVKNYNKRSSSAPASHRQAPLLTSCIHNEPLMVILFGLSHINAVFLLVLL